MIVSHRKTQKIPNQKYAILTDCVKMFLFVSLGYTKGLANKDIIPVASFKSFLKTICLHVFKQLSNSNEGAQKPSFSLKKVQPSKNER